MVTFTGGGTATHDPKALDNVHNPRETPGAPLVYLEDDVGLGNGVSNPGWGAPITRRGCLTTQNLTGRADLLSTCCVDRVVGVDLHSISSQHNKRNQPRPS